MKDLIRVVFSTVGFFIFLATQKPLRTEQHGFRKGRSCDSCLSVVYQEVEHALIKKHYTVSVYLDIEGCYLNTFNGEVGQKSEVEEIWKYQVGLTILHPFFESNLILPSK